MLGYQKRAESIRRLDGSGGANAVSCGFNLRANDIVRRLAVHAEGDVFSWWTFHRRPPRGLTVALQEP